MPTTTLTDLFSIETLLFFIKVVTLIILVFYTIFSLIIVRQVDLMSKTLITPVSSILKAFSILHAGLAVGLIFLAWGIL